MGCVMPTDEAERDGRAQDLAWQLRGGLCSRNWFMWDQLEKTYTVTAAQRAKPDAKVKAAAACYGCPLMATCHEWAHAGRYTGIAAGLVWFMGNPKTAPYWSACSTADADPVVKCA